MATTSTSTQVDPMMTGGTTDGQEQEQPKSALQDNIDRKGNNAYYFAHSHKANGPAWDGKAQPRLLSKTTTNSDSAAGSGADQTNGMFHQSSSSTFDYAKSNITSYAFSDEPKKVKLYIELPNVGEQCTDDDITLDYSERSFSLTVHKYKPPASTAATSTNPSCLSFARLSGPITTASFKRKDHRIILTLVKSEPDVVWHTINDKGGADHEVV